ncbi:hypothetical protein IPC442_13435 [Pseudomonas aeruginosa]|nr:hypothetical protein A6747_26395 [Pseudomonas aeruginosa]KJJ19688.1 hypothetical protein HMPREF3150_02135 [Pseudomonas aeruginosa]KXD23478.1 hypothetical protein AW904_02850 [Pseudomonas aeruginosa]KXD31579.1 hypothetical protein AW905_02820 [Pseudomonas aeruginosa]KXD33878.1 hypothetical protein AW906_02820 [Pseudomonas aeruginosa]
MITQLFSIFCFGRRLGLEQQQSAEQAGVEEELEQGGRQGRLRFPSAMIAIASAKRVTFAL